MKRTLLCGDCRELIQTLPQGKYCIVTDPPFNVGYHYSSYKDNMPKNEYLDMLFEIFNGFPCVIIHYPEMLHELSIRMGKSPTKVVSWVYNSNTAKQHRDIAFYDVKPDFSKVRQPYKNPNDKRIKERIEKGILGGRLYDWWNINQIKNVQKKKIDHPCVMPEEVMDNIIGILPTDYTIIDPFMGSGSTGVACVKANRKFIGFELDEKYFQIACDRLDEAEEKILKQKSLESEQDVMKS